MALIVPGKVYCGDAIRLLGKMDTHSVDHCISDPMWGLNVRYDWGRDPNANDPDAHWEHHRAYYEECLRVLRPGGVLAWCQSFKFLPYFDSWFGPHRAWFTIAYWKLNHFIPNLWVVQTKERELVQNPNNMLVRVDRTETLELKKHHPNPKCVEECEFLIRHLTQPGDLILDPFCGSGSVLVAAKRLGRRWLGCDISRAYCRLALARLRRPTLVYRPPPLSKLVSKAKASPTRQTGEVKGEGDSAGATQPILTFPRQSGESAVT